MKTVFVFLTIALSLASALFPVSNVDCANPAQIQHQFCGFVPAGCIKPICTADLNGKTQWFTSGCQMMVHNFHCPTRFRKTTEATCPPENRPPPSPQSCPWSRPL